jgi:hypothetical protein
MRQVYVDSGGERTQVSESDRATNDPTAASPLRAAVACLPADLRDVVVGYFLEGQTSAQLAERLGISEADVSVRRTAALRLMRTGVLAPSDDGAPAAAHRAASLAAVLAARSSFSSRLSQLPQQRTPEDEVAQERAAL